MPRQPRKRHCGVSRTRPFAFSSFGRSVARIAHKRKQSDPHTEDLLKCAGNGSAENVLEKKPLGYESSSEEEDAGTVQADFVFFDPELDDFHGVKLLLQNFLDNKQWDLSGFVDTVLRQKTVGTVIKIEDDEDDTPFAIVSALNLGRYEDAKCIMEIKEFMLKVCQKDVIGNLRMLLEEQANRVGFLVSQRVMNLPPQLLPPLYDALFDEVSWATEDEPTEELRDSFRFMFYLIATKIYKHKRADQHKRTSKVCTEDPIIFIKPEDEIFQKLSIWSFSFPLHSYNLGDQELRNYRLTGLVMAVEADKIPIFRRQLHSLINES